MRISTVLALAAAVFATRADARELQGPARFCGYAPIIDLLAGERIITLRGGIHSGSFRWEGSFGFLDVNGIGWTGRPQGKIAEARTRLRPARFTQRKEDGRYIVAIWNGANGAAYFSSPSPLTRPQIQAIRRVTLYEDGETPSGCDLHTTFVWE